MKTVGELRTEFSSVKSKKIPRAEKLPLVRTIRGGVSSIEKEAARDFSFPLEEIHKVKDFITELDDYLRP